MAQIGVVNSDSLIVTIKTDPIPGTVDVIHLGDGAVYGAADRVLAPAGTLAPFGFSVYPDGSAIITLAHSGHDGLFKRWSIPNHSQQRWAGRELLDGAGRKIRFRRQHRSQIHQPGSGHREQYIH